MIPYNFTEPDSEGSHLAIWAAAGGVSAALVRTRGRLAETVCVPASEVPAAARALFEAAGLPEPVILPRPELPADGKWRPASGSLLVASQQGGDVRVEFDIANGAASTMPPAKAREMAAALLALADKAEAEPGPDEIERLSIVIGDGGHDLDFESRWTLARAILLGGWKREPES